MKKVSILIPVYCEETMLPLLFPELRKIMDAVPNYEWEVMFIDDGSKDNSLQLLRDECCVEKRFHYISLSRNFGKENAMLAGFDYVSGDCMIVMDADLQDPPSLIPTMLKYWEMGYDDVYAKRADRGKESHMRKYFSLLFYKILDHATRFDILRNVGDFRLLDRKCINALKELRETERYTKGMFCWIGFKKKEVLFDRGDRIAGESKWNFLSLFNLAIEGSTSFTTAPLRFASMFGFLIAFGAFLSLIFYLFKRILLGDPVQGFTTLVIFILLSSGIQLLCIGILGEYIGRIFNESKRRPVYVIGESDLQLGEETHR